MKEINTKKYLTECDELLNEIRKNQLTYLIAGCGLGKSYYVKNIIMKEYKTLLVNFLNTTNEQNFIDTYKKGPTEARKYDGKTNISINVQNLKYISEEAIKEVDIVVIDEIQKLWQDINYRSCCGSELINNIEKFIKAGKKVLVMTGTPINDVAFLDRFEKIVVKKTTIEESDRYIFQFYKNLTYFNISRYVEELIKLGKYPVLLINKSWRHKIQKKLSEKGIKVGMVESDEKSIEGTATEYIIKNSMLPENYDALISTSIMQEGVNLVDIDKEIVFLTLIEEIKTPHQLIQFAGRARNQMKIVVSGFRKEDEFDINYLHSYYSNLDNIRINDKINSEFEGIISSEFNSFEDWKNYISSFTTSKIIVKEYKETEDGFKTENTKTDWSKVIELVRKNSEKTLVAKKLVDDVEFGYKVVEREENKLWIFTDNSLKCKQIIRIIKDNCLKSDVSDIDDYLLLYNTSWLMVKLVENSWNVLYKRILEKTFDNTTNDDEFFDLFKVLFEIKYSENGKEIDTKLIKENRLNHDVKKKIFKPFEVFVKYNETAKIFLSRMYCCIFMSIGKSINTRTPEEMFNLEYETFGGKSRKGIYSKDKFVLISDSSVKFKTLDEAFEYCKDNGLTKCKSLERFRKVEKDVVYKKI